MKIYAVKQNIIPCFRGQMSASKNFCSHENDKQTEYEKMSFRRREYLAKAICYAAALAGVITSTIWFKNRANKK